MSHIIKTKEELFKLRYLLSQMDIHDLRDYHLEELIDFLMPKDSNNNYLIDYRIIRRRVGNIAEFCPNYESIYFNLRKLPNWIEENYKSFCPNEDNPRLMKYLLLFCILHEIEHSYQYLMGKRLVESPCTVVSEVYDKLMDLLVKKEYIFPRPITQVTRYIRLFKYKKNENIYVLERNANIEAATTLIGLTSLEKQYESTKVFNDIVKICTLAGYTEDNKGCIYHTCENLLYKKFYNSINKDDINDEYRIRYGLEITEKERKKLIKKFTK